MNSSPVLILDASLLINFLKINRIDLVQAYPAKILITEHVRDEVTSAFPDQLARLDNAIAESMVEVIVINDLAQLEEIVTFREDKTQRQLGMGECSAIIIASKRNYNIGIDDGHAIKVIQREFPDLPIVQTVDVMLEAIRQKIIDVNEADAIKMSWATEHKFKLKIKTFRELL